MQDPLTATQTAIKTDQHTVILGGGLIGLSTAYQLAKATEQNRHNVQITIVDPASKMCAGASGQHEGVLATVDVASEQVQPLVDLSMKLDIAMASEYRGSDLYGFRGLDIHMLFSDGYDPKHPDIRWGVRSPEPMDRLPSWLNVSSEWEAGECSTAKESKKV